MVYDPMQAIEAFGAGRAYREQQDELQRARGLRNTQAKASAALMSGDTGAARQMAMGSGDVQTMQAIQQQIAQMDSAGREAARERVRGLGSAAYTLAQIPAGQRGQWVMQNGQSLAGLGVDPRQIAQMDLSDQNLAAFIRQAESMEQEFFAPYILGENEARFTASGDQRLNPNAALNRQVEQARLDETIRSNRADEGIALMNAETGRMGELRQREAFDLEQRGGSNNAAVLAQRWSRNDLVLQDIDRAIEQSQGFGTTGLLGQVMSPVGGTGARNLEALIDTVRANIGFDELQRMRDMSPTGGALGQVTERELAQLQAVLGNLETSQSGQQLRQNLQRLRETYARAQANIAAAAAQDGLMLGQQAPSAQSQADPLGIRG